MPTIVNVVGARPQFIKAGPISRVLEQKGIDELLVHTGQHYDPLMSDDIMRDIGLRDPDINLGVGSASHARQTAKILEGIEDVLMDTDVDAVLTYGDTNSTVAASLAAAKIGVFTAHIEAGLRSFNRKMPEELNRIATDHLSDLLLAPTETAMGHLQDEGLIGRAVLSGDVMVDALQSIDFDRVDLPQWAVGNYYCATIHRAENTDDSERLVGYLDSLSRLDNEVHLLAHPRLRKSLEALGLASGKGSLRIHEPLAYAEMLSVVRNSSALLTDSGGLQKEAFILHTPCITLRTETEWPETLEGGWNVLAEPGADLGPIVARRPEETSGHPFGTGTAAINVVLEVMKRL